MDIDAIREFAVTMQSIEANLKMDTGVSEKQLDQYSKYYSKEIFAQMKEDYNTIRLPSKYEEPISYSYIRDIFVDVLHIMRPFLLTEKTSVRTFPYFGIVATSRYSASKTSDGSSEILLFDFGLLWAIQLISDIVVLYFNELKRDEPDIKRILSMFCDTTICLIENRINILNPTDISKDDMIVASNIQYAITTFVCCHEYMHLLLEHNKSTYENENAADYYAACTTLEVMRNKAKDDRVAVVGMVVFFIYFDLVEGLRPKHTHSNHPPSKKRIKAILDAIMPTWLATAHNKKHNFMDSLFTEELIVQSLNKIYNDMTALTHVSSEIINDIMKGKNQHENND